MPYKFFVMLMGWSNHDIRFAIYQIFIPGLKLFKSPSNAKNQAIFFSSFNFYFKKKLSNVITSQVTRQRENKTHDFKKCSNKEEKLPCLSHYFLVHDAYWKKINSCPSYILCIVVLLLLLINVNETYLEHFASSESSKVEVKF